MTRRTHSNDEIGAALAAANGDKLSAAAALGCSTHVIYRYLAEECVASVPRRQGVAWDAAAILRLREMASRTPRPSAAEIAAAFGTSAGAVQSAMTRAGITKSLPPAASGKPRATIDYSKPPAMTNFRSRDCMCCKRPFLSEGSHNRMCIEYKNGNRSVA